MFDDLSPIKTENPEEYPFKQCDGCGKLTIPTFELDGVKLCEECYDIYLRT